MSSLKKRLKCIPKQFSNARKSVTEYAVKSCQDPDQFRFNAEFFKWAMEELPIQCCIILAASHGDDDFVKIMIDSRRFGDLYGELAYYGKIHLLMYAKDKQIVFDKSVFLRAIAGFQLDCAKWLQKWFNYDLSPDVMNTAAMAGEVSMVRWLESQGCTSDNATMDWALMSKSIELVKYFRAQGYAFGNQSFLAAASTGDLNILHYIFEKSICRQEDEKLCMRLAARNVECFKFLVIRGFGYDSKICAKEAVEYGCVETLEALEKLCRDLIGDMRYTVGKKSLKCLKWLRDHGYKNAMHTCYSALEANLFECFVCACENCESVDYSSLMIATDKFTDARIVTYIEDRMDESIRMCSAKECLSRIPWNEYEIVTDYINKSGQSLEEFRFDAEFFEWCRGSVRSADILISGLANDNTVKQRIKDCRNGSLYNGLAYYGRVNLLEYAKDQGVVFDKSVFQSAVSGKRLNCAKWLLEWFHFALSSDSLNTAARTGYIPMIKWLMSLGCAIDERTMYDAVSSGSVDCVKHLHVIGGRFDMWACISAAKTGNLDILRYVVNNSTHHAMDEEMCVQFAACNAECFKFLIICGFRHNIDRCAMEAVRAGCVGTLEIMASLDCEFNDSMCDSIGRKSFECLVWLHEHGCKTTMRSCVSAIGANSFECFVYACENCERVDYFSLVRELGDLTDIRIKEYIRARI